MAYDYAYAPFAEQYAPSGSGTTYSFTGQNSDIGSNLWDFTFREYHSSQGRWIVPDPAGLQAVDPTNPQTWNRYGYVGGNPLANVDPNGLVTLPGCEEGDDFSGCSGGGMGGSPIGCFWIDSSFCPPIAIPLPDGGGGGPILPPPLEGGGRVPGPPGGGSTNAGGGGGIANFPNEENLGIPPGVSANWGGILGAVLPIDPSCEFGACLPIGSNFEGGEIAAAGVCVFVEPCGTIAVAVGIGVAAVEAGAIIYLARKTDIQQAEAARREVERICGRPIDRKTFHDLVVSKQGLKGFKDMVREGVSWFCPDKAGSQ
jgi:RHS repeat-associated protein